MLVLEDDGIAEQSPPIYHAKREPDDPREVFSPNYGSVAPVANSDASADGGADAGGNDGYDPFLDSPRWDKYKTMDGAGDQVGTVRRNREHSHYAALR